MLLIQLYPTLLDENGQLLGYLAMPSTTSPGTQNNFPVNVDGLALVFLWCCDGSRVIELDSYLLPCELLASEVFLPA